MTDYSIDMWKISLDRRQMKNKDPGMKKMKTMNRKKLSFLLLLIASLILLTPGVSWSVPSKWSKAQIDKIQESIQNSKNMSDKSFELIGNAHQNTSVAISNFENTRIEGFRQASNVFSDAEQKFVQARRTFDDAWIRLQGALINSDMSAVQEGINLYNSGVQAYNEGVELRKKAHGIFEIALGESKTTSRRSTTSRQFAPNVNNNPARQRSPGGSPSLPGSSTNAFPVVAMIVLLGTVMTSLQAFKDEQVLDKFILHPWSIVRHGKRHYTLLTSGLIHADAMHLTMNLMSFCFFAFILETIVGHRNFLIIYFGSLIFSSFIVAVKNGNNASYRALGASGAIAGVIFSFILYRPTSKISLMFAPIPIPAPVFAVLYLAYSYYMAKNKYDNVGHDAHLWGAISGALITMVLDPSSIMLFRSYLRF